jgi:hypothetical protein
MAVFLTLTARVLTGVVLVVSIAAKTRTAGERAEFTRWVRSLGAVPPPYVPRAAATLVGAECAVVVLLALPWTGPAGLALAAALLLFFAAAIAWVGHHGVTVPCRCFGNSARPMGRAQILRNVALAGAAAAAAAGPVQPDRPLAAADATLAVLLGATTALVVTRLDDIAELFSPSHREAPPIPSEPAGEVS